MYGPEIGNIQQSFTDYHKKLTNGLDESSLPLDVCERLDRKFERTKRAKENFLNRLVINYIKSSDLYKWLEEQSIHDCTFFYSTRLLEIFIATTVIIQFRNDNDAMLFKLTWF